MSTDVGGGHDGRGRDRGRLRAGRDGHRRPARPGRVPGDRARAARRALQPPPGRGLRRRDHADLRPPRHRRGDAAQGARPEPLRVDRRVRRGADGAALRGDRRERLGRVVHDVPARSGDRAGRGLPGAAGRAGPSFVACRRHRAGRRHGRGHGRGRRDRDRPRRGRLRRRQQLCAARPSASARTTTGSPSRGWCATSASAARPRCPRPGRSGIRDSRRRSSRSGPITTGSPSCSTRPGAPGPRAPPRGSGSGSRSTSRRTTPS